MNWPSTLKTCAQCRGANIQKISPVSNGHAFTSKRNESSVCAVLSLLFFRRPSHVTWYVPFRRLDAVERVLWGWAGADGAQKYFEIVPGGMNLYTRPSVAGIVFVLGVHATRAHAEPTSIFCGHGSSAGRAVSDSMTSIVSKTTARFSRAVPKKCAFDVRLFTAVTTTRPHDCALISSGLMKDDQSTESLSGEVFDQRRDEANRIVFDRR